MIQNQISETAHSDLSTSAVSVLKGEEDDEEQEDATSELKQDAAWAQIEKQVIALEERATSAELKLTDALSALEEARAGRAEAARIEQAQELRLKQAESMVQELSRSNDLLRSLVGDGSRHPSDMPLAFKHCIQSALIFEAQKIRQSTEQAILSPEADKKKDDFKDATGALDNVGNVSDIQFKREVLAALDGLLAVVLRRKSEEAIQSSEPRPKVPPQKEANVELTSNISGVLKRLRAEISELMSLAGKSLETRKALEDLKVRYFFSLGVLSKMQAVHAGWYSNVDLDALYLRALRENVEIVNWSSWISHAIDMSKQTFT